MKAALVLATALAALQVGAVAAQPRPSVVTMPDYAERPTGADLITYYPKAAAAQNIEGRATMSCTVDARGQLNGCAVLSEEPAGAGFGAAALGLAPLFKMRPMTRDGVPVSGGVVNIPIRFTLPPPPAAAPAGSVSAETVTWVRKPTRYDFDRVFPLKALEESVEGGATLQCVVDARGGLAKCSVIDQTPADKGFGAAALDLSGYFRMSPKLADGASAEGRPIRIPIHFNLPRS